MSVFNPPTGDLGFALRHVIPLNQILALPGYETVNEELIDSILDEAGKFARDQLAPLNPEGDKHPAILENGVVRTTPGYKEAFHAMADGGWIGLPFPEQYGGQSLPWVVSTAVSEIWNGAAMTFYLSQLLGQAAIEALLHHGSDVQKDVYLKKLVSGQWTGAMCLTESQAGTDVGALRTRAEPDGDHYRIFGQKIYITFGEHDMTENIVHLVLARLPDGVPGSKGISLFIVPKFIPNEDGSLGPRNDMHCIKLEEKLGIHGSPTCVMSYGDNDGAIGYLLGTEHTGMRCMFTMMNNARLAVGLEGVGIAERAYQQALAYANDRVQGCHKGQPAAIIAYGDVQRSLLTMRAQIAAMRALCLMTAGYIDQEYRSTDAETAKTAAQRVALLTPIVKAWCTDRACEIASTGLQIHGGMGFIEETGAAQHYRDARILPIYEGTNGVQAMDLIGRKLSMEGGTLPWNLFKEFEQELTHYKAPVLDSAFEALRRTTKTIQDMDEDRRGEIAQPYLTMFGTILGAILLARGAHNGPESMSTTNWSGLSKIYNRFVLPPAVALESTICDPGDPLDTKLLAS